MVAYIWPGGTAGHMWEATTWSFQERRMLITVHVCHETLEVRPGA